MTRICHSGERICSLGKLASALLQFGILGFRSPCQAAVFITLSDTIKKSSRFLFGDQQFNTQSKEENEFVSTDLDVQPCCLYQKKQVRARLLRRAWQRSRKGRLSPSLLKRSGRAFHDVCHAACSGLIVAKRLSSSFKLKILN